MCTYIYICVKRERERERDRDASISLCGGIAEGARELAGSREPQQHDPWQLRVVSL